MIFLINMLKTEAVLASTHNLCFGPKIKNTSIPQFYYMQVGFKGVFVAWTCFPDALLSGPGYTM